MNTRRFVERGGWWVAAQLALMAAAIVLAPLFRGPWHNVVSTVAGAMLFGTGGWFGIAGGRALGRNRTAFPRPLPDSTLVQGGVYGLVRHPLYSSLIFVSASWALLWSSGEALLAALALAVLLDAKARLEERWLRAKFPEYAAYAGRVRRLLPWVY